VLRRCRENPYKTAYRKALVFGTKGSPFEPGRAYWVETKNRTGARHPCGLNVPSWCKMKKLIRYEFASGWVLTREYDSEKNIDITEPLRQPDDLFRLEDTPVIGHAYAVFLPREQVVRFDFS
jgi:hypothetical protein